MPNGYPMGQINARLRSLEDAHFAFYCPGCECLHMVPTSWAFNGDFERPTTTPSVRHSDHRGTTCHYNVTDGQLVFHGDNPHALNAQTVPIPDLPDWLRDDPEPMLFSRKDGSHA